MINTRAAGDSRFARTGKDGAIYNADGVLLATVDSFTANVTYNNAAYSVLGNAQELETANTFKVALTMSQVVVEDDAFIQELVEAMESQTMPVWDFQGVLKGRNGTEWYTVSVSQADRLIYRISLSEMLSREHGTLRSTDHLSYRTYWHWVKRYSAVRRRVPKWHPPFNFNNTF